jgi:hypothetical protein
VNLLAAGAVYFRRFNSCEVFATIIGPLVEVSLLIGLVKGNYSKTGTNASPPAPETSVGSLFEKKRSGSLSIVIISTYGERFKQKNNLTVFGERYFLRLQPGFDISLPLPFNRRGKSS